MSYLYRSRHTRRVARPPRVPVAAASAVLAIAAGLGAVTLHGGEPSAGTPVAVAESAAAESAAPRETAAAASRGKRPAADRSAAPSAGGAKPSAGSAAPPASKAAPSATSAAPAPAPPAPAEAELKYQFAWQENFYFCGPAATRIALTVRDLYPSQSQVAQSLGTTVNGTNSSADTTRALNALTGSDFYTAHFILGQGATADDTEQLRQAVVHAVSNGYAVVANIAGSTVDDAGHAHAYPGGHYLTIVGYSDNGNTVKIADPADALGVGSYTLTVKRMADWIALRGYAA